jgi:hypothetical protein
MKNVGIDQHRAPEGSAAFEKRSQDRLSLQLIGTVVFDPIGRAVEAKVLSNDINGYGGYFLTHTRPKMGERVELDLHDPAHPSQPELSLGAVGEILRVDRLSKDAFGFAVTFDIVTH